MSSFSTSTDIYDESHTWQWRAVRASLGTTTGLIVLSMLGQEPKVGHAFLGTAEIDVNGRVHVKHRLPIGDKMVADIGHIHHVRDAIRRLADHIRLSDRDREAMFEELRKWIAKDHRATSHGELTGARI